MLLLENFLPNSSSIKSWPSSPALERDASSIMLVDGKISFQLAYFAYSRSTMLN